MPELPEVETVRRSLLPHLVGRTVGRAVLFRADFVTGDSSPAALLQGATIASLQRRGKQLAIIAGDGRSLIVQLGMTGQVLIAEPSAPIPAHVHAVLTITGTGRQVRFRDPRRFGGLTTLATPAELNARWESLGPDGLTITGRQLAAAVVGSSRAIKAALLDQSVVAGVGNIYADESLFSSGIHPKAICRRISPQRLDELARALRSVLSRAVKARGSTLRDYRDADGAEGGYAASHRVYGRGGKPCTRCGTTLRKTTVAQRATVFCPDCQRR